jgi:hypothetical protein
MTQNRWIFTAAALAALAAPHARHYRFTMEYFTFDVKGHFVQKQRIVGDYTAGEPETMCAGRT